MRYALDLGVGPSSFTSAADVSITFLMICKKSYSGDIPPGTAIPHWAFYNVTVRDLPDLHQIDRAYVDVR